MLRMKEVTALKDASENLNTRKSTINWVTVFENWCDEIVVCKNLATVLPEQLDNILEWFFACVCKQDGTYHDCERNLSPMTLKGKGLGKLLEFLQNAREIISKFHSSTFD